MSKNPLPKILLAILTMIAIASVILCVQYVKRTKELRSRQVTTNVLNSRQQLFGMLINDTAEYAKQHPAMDQLLRSINVPQPQAQRPAAPAATTPKTGTK